MEKIQFLDHFESWKLLVSVFIALLGASFFYFKELSYPKSVRAILLLLRFSSIFLLLVIFWGPKVKVAYNEYKTPKVVLLVDNSRSLQAYKNELLSSVKLAQSNYESLGYEVDIMSFDGAVKNADSIKFNVESSDFNQILSSVNRYHQIQNLSHVDFYSDGIETSDYSILAQRKGYQLNTIGLGDSTVYQDIKVVKVAKNKTVVKSNRFMVKTTLEATNNLIGETIKLSLIEGDKSKSDTTLVIRKSKFLISLADEAKSAGLKKYKVQVKVLNQEEKNLDNNAKSFYISVLDKSKKYLLVYQSPHPDVKFIKSIFANKEGVSLESVSYDQIKSKDLKSYELVIAHNLVSLSMADKLRMGQVPFFSFIGNRTSAIFYSQAQKDCSINPSTGVERVSLSINPLFKVFKVNVEQLNTYGMEDQMIRTVATNSVKMGSMKTLLNQNVGRVKLEVPAFAIQINSKHKHGFCLTTDFWLSRINMLANNQYVDAFDQLFFKTFDLLSETRKSSRLKFDLDKDEYYTSDRILTTTQVLNKAYEPIYGQEVSIRIKSDNGYDKVFRLKTDRNLSKLELSRLPAGLYNYTTSTNIDGEKFTLSGKFAINLLDLESKSQRADFKLLSDLAKQHNGEFRTLRQPIGEYQSATKVIHTTYDEKELKDNYWLLAVIVLLIAAEWFLRKYFGSL